MLLPAGPVEAGEARLVGTAGVAEAHLEAEPPRSRGPWPCQAARSPGPVDGGPVQDFPQGAVPGKAEEHALHLAEDPEPALRFQAAPPTRPLVPPKAEKSDCFPGAAAPRHDPAAGAAVPKGRFQDTSRARRVFPARVWSPITRPSAPASNRAGSSGHPPGPPGLCRTPDANSRGLIGGTAGPVGHAGAEIEPGGAGLMGRSRSAAIPPRPGGRNCGRQRCAPYRAGGTDW